MNLYVKRVMLFACVVTIGFSACKKDHLPKGPVPADDSIEVKAPVQTPVYVKINNVIGGYYQALPAMYGITTKSYPTLISIHGGGQTGNGNTQLPFLLNDGVAKMIAQGKFPAHFTVDGKIFSFIVLSPQFTKYPGEAEVQSFIDYAKKKYRIDDTRLYITGLSLGGYVASDMGAAYTSEIAAIVPFSGVSVSGDLKTKAANIAKGKLPAWYFINSGDTTVSVASLNKFTDLIKSNNPAVPPKSTVFQQSGHDSWSKVLDSTYKEDGVNIFEWMLHYHR